MADRLDEHLLAAALAPVVWSGFDAAWYARAYPEAGGGGFARLRAHWIEHGQAAGLSPVRYFDEAWYRAEYPDVAAAIAAGVWRSGFEHYCLEGHAGRAPNGLFDPVFYAASHPDWAAAGCINSYDHFLKIGAASGAIGHPLVEVTGFGDFLDALRFGADEPAPSVLFDPAWYRATYPQAAGGALRHYLSNATPCAFDPLPDFVEAHYLAEAPEAAALVEAGVFRNGYAHFVACGAAARRSPAPWIDLEFYVAQHSEAAAHPFRHLLTTGRALGLRTAADAGDEVARRGLLPLLARGRLDFNLAGPAALTAIVLMPADRAQALAALGMLRAAAPGAVELFLLDWNGEAEGLAALAGGARVLTCGAGELAVACNAALRESAGAAVLLLDGRAAPNAAGLQAGLRRLAEDASVGAVGGPVLGADGRLLEAGAFVLPDGAMRSYLRRAAGQVSEAGFVREVDGFRGTQLLLRRGLLQVLEGFADGLADGEAAMDVCLRAWQAGYRVIYDPAMAAVLPDPRAQRVTGLPGAASAGLATRHVAYLRRARAGGTGEHVRRDARAGNDVVLLVVPQVPRDGDALVARIAALTAEGAAVTVYPLDGGPSDPAVLPPFLPETVEIICGPGEAGLPAFLSARGEGFFSVVERV